MPLLAPTGHQKPPVNVRFSVSDQVAHSRLAAAAARPIASKDRLGRLAGGHCQLDFELIFGPGGPRRGSAHDLFQLATSLADSDRPKPRLYQCCGTEDILHAQNTRFRDAVQLLGFDYLYEEGPGDHSWAYWDTMISRTLTWLEQGSRELWRSESDASLPHSVTDLRNARA